MDDIARVFGEMVQFAQEHTADVTARAAELMASRFNKDVIVRAIVDGFPGKKDGR